MIDIFLIGLLIPNFGLAYEFFHLFNEVLGQDSFMTSELAFFKKVDDNYLNVVFIE
jgi:hypothetical protein